MSKTDKTTAQPHVLYLSYNGALEPLGVNQIIIYLLVLSQTGLRYTLVTFEKSADLNDPARVAAMRQLLAAHQIQWLPLRYYRGSLWAVLRNIAQGVRMMLRLAWRERFAAIHVRSYLPLLFGLPLQLLQRTRLIFDLRGFWADERVDWQRCRRNSLQYRIIKGLEWLGLARANVAVVLSSKARSHLQKIAIVQKRQLPIAVVPCFVDATRFRPKPAERAHRRRAYGWEDNVVLVHSGSLGGLHLVDEIVACFQAGQRLEPRLRLLVLTPSDPQRLIDKLQASAIDPSSWRIEHVTPEQMPDVLVCADLGLALIKPTFSKIASWPTKLGEYLATGIPVLTTPNIGDTAEFLQQHEVGVVLADLTAAGCAAGMQALLELTRRRADLVQHCRETALRHLDVNSAGQAQYLTIYNHLQLATKETSS